MRPYIHIRNANLEFVHPW